jgi:hypothetical protein
VQPYALLQLEQRFGRRELEAGVPGGVGVFEVAVGGVREVDLLAAGGDVEPGGSEGLIWAEGRRRKKVARTKRGYCAEARGQGLI